MPGNDVLFESADFIVRSIVRMRVPIVRWRVPFVLVAFSIALSALTPNAAADERALETMRDAFNTQRKQRALNPLVTDPRLTLAAQRLATQNGKGSPARRQNNSVHGSQEFCGEVERAGFPCAGVAMVRTLGNLPVIEVARAMFDDPQTRPGVASPRYRFFGIGVVDVTDPRHQGLRDWVILLGDPPEPAMRNWRKEVLRLVNQFRAEYKLLPLTLSPLLNEAAQRHADDMAYRDYVAHLAPDGTDHGTRISDTGYDWHLALENLAAGQGSPREAVEGWKNSPGHRKAMLNRRIREAGIGYRFLVQDEGRTRNFHYWALNMAEPR